MPAGSGFGRFAIEVEKDAPTAWPKKGRSTFNVHSVTAVQGLLKTANQSRVYLISEKPLLSHCSLSHPRRDSWMGRKTLRLSAKLRVRGFPSNRTSGLAISDVECTWRWSCRGVPTALSSNSVSNPNGSAFFCCILKMFDGMRRFIVAHLVIARKPKQSTGKCRSFQRIRLVVLIWGFAKATEIRALHQESAHWNRSCDIDLALTSSVVRSPYELFASSTNQRFQRLSAW